MDLILTSIQTATTNAPTILGTLKIFLFASIILPNESHVFFALIMEFLPEELLHALQVETVLQVINLFAILSVCTFLLQIIGIAFEITESSIVIENPSPEDETTLDKINGLFSTVTLILLYFFTIYSQLSINKISLNLMTSPPNSFIELLPTFSLLLMILLFFLHLFDYLFLLWLKKKVFIIFYSLNFFRLDIWCHLSNFYPLK